YRRLARKFHPDVSKEANAEARFKEIGEAYEVLKDPEKRAEYDQLRRYGATDGADFTPPPGWGGGRAYSSGNFDPESAQGFSDFFEAIFGRAAGGRRARGTPFNMHGDMRGDNGGEDIHYRLPIALEDAYNGAQRTISFPVHELNAQGQVTQSTK